MVAIDWNSALERARACSPFLTQVLDRLPDLAAQLAQAQANVDAANAQLQSLQAAPPQTSVVVK